MSVRGVLSPLWSANWPWTPQAMPECLRAIRKMSVIVTQYFHQHLHRHHWFRTRHRSPIPLPRLPRAPPSPRAPHRCRQTVWGAAHGLADFQDLEQRGISHSVFSTGGSDCGFMWPFEHSCDTEPACSHADPHMMNLHLNIFWTTGHPLLQILIHTYPRPCAC